MTTWQLRTVGTLARPPGLSDSDGGPSGVRSERHRRRRPPGARALPLAAGRREDRRHPAGAPQAPPGPASIKITREIARARRQGRCRAAGRVPGGPGCQFEQENRSRRCHDGSGARVAPGRLPTATC